MFILSLHSSDSDCDPSAPLELIFEKEATSEFGSGDLAHIFFRIGLTSSEIDETVFL